MYCGAAAIYAVEGYGIDSAVCQISASGGVHVLGSVLLYWYKSTSYFLQVKVQDQPHTNKGRGWLLQENKL